MTVYNDSFDHCKPFSDTAPQYQLAANTALSYTVPGDNTMRYRVEFHYNASDNIYVALNATATTPTLGVMNSSSVSEYRPDVRYVRGGDVLSFKSADAAAQGGFSLLQLPN